MRQIPIALLASSGLVTLVLAGPALAQGCSERLAELEARMTKLEPSSEERRNLQELIEAARVLEWLERGQGCLTVLDEAEGMLRPAEAQAERDVRRQEQAVLQERQDDLEDIPADGAGERPGATGEPQGAGQDSAGASGPSGTSSRASPQPQPAERGPGAATAPPSERDGGRAQQQVSERLRALPPDELIGMSVHDRQGETIAEVIDLVRQTDDGSLFAVLSVGGFLGLGTKEVAVPLHEFELGQEDGLRLPSRSAEQVENLPPYNKTQYAKVTE